MTTEQAKEVLRNAGYFVENLWHVDDVRHVTEESISNEQAMEVLSMALTNEATMEQIWMSIDMATELLTD